MEPRASWTKRRPAPPGPETARASKPTFDLSDGGGWATASHLRALENRWQKAIKDHDVETIDELLAEDFVATSSTGKVGSKSTLLYEVGRDKNVYESSSARGMSVRSLGPGVAVVTGTATETGTTKSGKRFTNRRRFTDTWRQRNGKWQCVASQATQIR
ncbi:MAG: nuclear transport factor 2 family protein [Chthoniobacterales bacterium]